MKPMLIALIVLPVILAIQIYILIQWKCLGTDSTVLVLCTNIAHVSNEA